jgi:hypothetical protein
MAILNMVILLDRISVLMDKIQNYEHNSSYFGRNASKTNFLSNEAIWEKKRTVLLWLVVCALHATRFEAPSSKDFWSWSRFKNFPMLSFWCWIQKQYFQKLRKRKKQNILHILKKLCFLKKKRVPSNFPYFWIWKKHFLKLKTSFSWSAAHALSISVKKCRKTSLLVFTL